MGIAAPRKLGSPRARTLVSTRADALASGRPGQFPTPAPHGSGRAQFRHPAPRAMISLRDQTDASQPSRRQRVAPLQLAETLPRDVCLVRAATEPLLPGMPHVVSVVAQARVIAGNPVIREMSEQPHRQGDPPLPDSV